jgi:hypothetical protein
MNPPAIPGLGPSPEQAGGIRLRILSLGAGVQSTALALMAAYGEIGPMPDCAIFADAGWEPKAVYEHLAWLRSSNVLPFPVHIVSAGDLRAGIVTGARGERWASIPAFTRKVTRQGPRFRSATRTRMASPLSWAPVFWRPSASRSA